MTEDVSSLRSQLREESPGMHAALRRSWVIAETEWLPTISGNKGCFNSYPHLRNLERYASEVLDQTAAVSPKAEALQLSAVEKYLLLAAILFHDIGRSKPDDSRPHAQVSRGILRDHFADLGIENQRLAWVLADICCYHDCSPEIEQSLDLNDHSITPYGLIHAKRLAVFLKFIDELDSAYTRVYPHYLASNPSNIIEGFRRSISGIRLELGSRTIITTVALPARSLAPWPKLEDNEAGKAEPDVNEERVPEPRDAYRVGVGETAEWKKWQDLSFDVNKDYARKFLPIDHLLAHAAKEVLVAWKRMVEVTEWFGEVREADEKTKKAWKALTDGAVQHPTVPPINHSLCRYKPVFRDLDPDNCIQALGGVFDTSAFRPGIPAAKERDQFGLAPHDWLGIDESLLAEWQAPQETPQSEGAGRQSMLGRIVPRPFAAIECPLGYLPLPRLDTAASIRDLVPYLILRSLIYPSLASAPEPEDNSRVFFLNLAGAMRGSARKLSQMKMELATYGIPAEAWVLEYGEHLFTSAGRETYEAVLSRDFLRDVVDHMWHLAAGMFGREPCSYATLAARLRVGNLDRVRTAVRRVAIVTRHRAEGKADHCYSIRFSANDWRWMPHDECRFRDQDLGKWHGQECILGRIEQLADPRKDI